ncbi:MAG: hypothetical protein GFH23_1086674n90 [Chloroflexi bacterium AL-N1]|nr:hypothetical protein [Chloroflexi bacterium AL-N1]NOK92189.1 hypothetical protein [Chloroflexi bacterium AL-N15]
MLALFAILVLLPLLYIPGYLLTYALLGVIQTGDTLEHHFERVVLGTLLNGWIAFTLAQIGFFSFWLHLSILILCCLGCFIVYRRRAPLQEKHSQSASPSFLSRLRHSDALPFIIISCIFIVLISRPFEVVLGVRDAGMYANTGFAIAQTGGIVQDDPILKEISKDQQSPDDTLRLAAEQTESNLIGNQHPERWNATGLRFAGFYIVEGDLAQGYVTPQNFHLFPVWIGLMTSLLGNEGGLLATGLMGLLGVWSVGMLGRRLANMWVGSVAMLLLALNGVQVWFSRYPMTETTAQFLIFAGLYGFAVMVEKSHQLEANDETTNPHSLLRYHRELGALIAGLAFGQLALTRIDFALVVGPVLAYIGYIWLTHRWQRQHTLLALALGAMLVHAAIHVMTIARAYFFDTLFARLQDYALVAIASLPFLTPTLQVNYLTQGDTPLGIRLGPGLGFLDTSRIILEVGVVLFGIGLLLLIHRWGQPVMTQVERILQRHSRWLLQLAALGVLILALYGYFIRPQILSSISISEVVQCISTGQFNTGACLTLQGYIGAPIAIPDTDRAVFTIPLANLVRVGWYLSPIGIILGILGFTLWWKRGFNQASWLLLITGLVASVVFVRQSYGTSDQTYIYILRRFVPHVYPVFCLSIAYGLYALKDWRWQSGGSPNPSFVGYVPRILAGGLVVTLVVFLLVTNQRLYRHTEYAGALDQLSIAAQPFTSDDVLLMRGGSAQNVRDIPDIIATPLKYTFGLNTFTIKSPEPGNYTDEISNYIRHWQEQGRNVYALLSASGGLTFPGFTLEPTGDDVTLQLREFQQLTNQKPSNVQDFSLHFKVYRIIPASSEQEVLDITVDDYATQIRGFYRPENIEGATLAWTHGDALLRMPWPQDRDTLSFSIELAGGQRAPENLPNQTCLSFRPETNFWISDPAAPPFTPLTCFDISEQPDTYEININLQEHTRSSPETLLLRIDSEEWIPAEEIPGENDGRQLGVLFGGITIMP